MIIAIGSIILDRRLPWDVPAGSHVFQRETADTTYLREQHRRASREADRFQEMANQYRRETEMLRDEIGRNTRGHQQQQAPPSASSTRTMSYEAHRPASDNRGQASENRGHNQLHRPSSYSDSPTSSASRMSVSSPEQARLTRRMQVAAVNSGAALQRQPEARQPPGASSTIDVRAEGFVDNRQPAGLRQTVHAHLSSLDQVCNTLAGGSRLITLHDFTSVTCGSLNAAGVRWQYSNLEDVGVKIGDD